LIAAIGIGALPEMRRNGLSKPSTPVLKDEARNTGLPETATNTRRANAARFVRNAVR
jgi:hypothetical protein